MGGNQLRNNMREFNINLDDYINTGLRRDERNPINKPGLLTCLNTKPKKDLGLVPYEPITLPFSDATLAAASVTISFPFPQLFRGKDITLLIDETKLFEVDESDWSLTLITIYDPYSEGSTKNITAGGVWQMLDFGSTWFLFNGNCTIFRTQRRTMVGDAEKTFVLDTMTIRTGCDFKGRAILGGFNPSNFWGDDYKQFWDEWLKEMPVQFSNTMNMDTNFVLWSSIGGGDLLFWIYPELAMKGFVNDSDAHSISKPLIFDYLKRNDLGFMPMPWQGTVHCIKPLGKNVIVYGSGGVTALPQVSDPVSTFGMIPISHIGIADRGAVGGDENFHIFLDDAGYLWLIDSKLQMTELGYKEFLYPMLGNDIVISFNEHRKEWLISDASNCYVLTDVGLGKCNQLVSSADYTDGGTVGIYTSSGGNTGQVITDIFDMKSRSIKTITVVELGLDSTTPVQVQVHYRFEKSDAFTAGGYKLTNKEGVVYPIVSGIDFKIEIKATDYTAVYTNSCIVRYKTSDRRSVRGRYGY